MTKKHKDNDKEETTVYREKDVEPMETLAPAPTVVTPGTGATLVSHDPAHNTAPTVIDVPLVYQQDAQIICTMGNWNGEPTSYEYQWQEMVADEWTNVGMGTMQATYDVTPEMVGHTVLCAVTATNEAGATLVKSNPVIVIAPV